MNDLTPLTPEILCTYREACRERFEEKELKRMHKTFYTACPSGFMDSKTFTEYIREMNVFPLTMQSETFPHLFRGYDVDGDGSVSVIDFIQYHTAVVHADVELLQRVVFAMYDIDQDGVISKEEMVDVVTQATRLCGDTDVTTSTVQMLIHQEVEKIIAVVDVDCDGQISREDLQLTSERHPQVLEKMRNLA